MNKFIPYEKLSKKKKRELDAAKRTTWGALNPVTRRTPNPRAYDRQKARRWKYRDHPDVPSAFFLCRGGCITGRRHLCGRNSAVQQILA